MCPLKLRLLTLIPIARGLGGPPVPGMSCRDIELDAVGLDRIPENIGDGPDVRGSAIGARRDMCAMNLDLLRR